MLRAVFHIGAHKTATTSFQELASAEAAKLREANIFYPSTAYGQPGHQWLAHQLVAGDVSLLASCVEEFTSTYRDEATLLISSEDLEGLLVQPEKLTPIEQALRQRGIDSISWIFTMRDPFDYFCSLYAELCKHDVIVNFMQMAETILKTGVYRASSPSVSWDFAFDYTRLLADLAAASAGKVYGCTFKAFTADLVGKPIFECIAAASQGEVQALQQALIHTLALNGHTSRRNERLSLEDVERRYSSLFVFGTARLPAPYYIRFSKAWALKMLQLDPWGLCERLTQERVSQIEACHEHYRNRFLERFGEIDQQVTLMLISKD